MNKDSRNKKFMSLQAINVFAIYDQYKKMINLVNKSKIYTENTHKKMLGPSATNQDQMQARRIWDIGHGRWYKKLFI